MARSFAVPDNGIRALFRGAGRQSDLALAALLMAIVALFVLPLPTPVLDLLIATNLSISLVLIVVAMYIPSALSLSTFPSLLLFTTLFRLALNIASTKLILLHANAGHIIDTFGKLIVGNNVVVGGVVFLIIAIVQFIVVAKGSERVAEVAARFALDAMPGKQMSIDAEVRAGVLSSEQAQRRRQMLERESSLHGAMDGAMKFVKGDAIAGIVIAVVNILAGITIGTLMRDMSLGDALQRYAILTVGDGMVSQIPSLLVSIAAGIVITRVDSSGSQLAGQIGSQLLAHPRALAIAGLAVASFIIVPGFPKWVFLLLSATILGLAWVSRSFLERGRIPLWISHRDEEDIGSDAPAPIAAPLAVRLAQGLRRTVDLHLLDQRLAAGKANVEGQLGPVFPHIQVSFSGPADSNDYVIEVHGVAVARGTLNPGRLLLDPGAVAVPGDAQIAEPFGPFARVAWVERAPEDARAWTPEEVVGLHVEHAVRQHASELLGLQEVHRLLQSLQREAPDLATEISRVVPTPRMAEVLRRLLQEGVPVRNLLRIGESLVNWAQREQDTIALTEQVRIDMGRYITSRYVGADRQLPVVLFESNLLDTIAGAIERSPTGNRLLLNPSIAEDIREQMRRIVDSVNGRVVAVVSFDVRRYVKLLLQPAIPQLVVLSYQEIDDDVALHPVGWITHPQTA